MDTTQTTRPAPRPNGRAQELKVNQSEWAQLRERANFSQRELETASGVSRGIISLIESDRRLQPKPSEAARILSALAVRGVRP